MSLFAEVVFPLPLDRPFLYAVPECLRERARPGCRVLVPLGKKRQVGFIVALAAEGPGAGVNVKSIEEVLDAAPRWGGRFLGFTGALSSEFLSSWGELLLASLPPSLAKKKKTMVRLTDAGRAAHGTKRLGRGEKPVAGLLLDAAAGRSPLFLQRKTGVRDMGALIARMKRKGWVTVEEREVPVPRLLERVPEAGQMQLQLDFPGGRAADPGALAPVERALDAGRFAAFYLFGPDSSRSAAHHALIRRALEGGGRVLLLVPEVALTRDFVSGFDRFFGRKAVVFHSGMTERQKENAWRALRSGRASVAAGTRSALFLEMGALRLIVVDGEHEESFFQAESPSYDARRGAWLRARAENAVVVLGSSKPTVEGFHEAGRSGALIELAGEPRRTRISWIDHQDGGPLLSAALVAKVRSAIGLRTPVILFLNRRGYAASMACARCGAVPRCRRCDIPLVYHKREDRLVCHYCDSRESGRSVCAACGGSLAVRRGPGTQALEEELGKTFPDAGISRFDADTASGRGERERILADFSKGRISVLVATRLLVHQPDVPKARLVGILSPESLLGMSDYRTGQRTFQTVAAMVEFAEDESGAEAVVQTPAPVHYSIQTGAEGRFREFFDREIEFRRVMNYPPFSAFAEVTLLGREVRALGGKSRELGDLLRARESGLEVLGPAFASVGRVKDLLRIQIILKAARRNVIEAALRETLPRIRLRKSVLFSYSPFGDS